MTWLYEINYVSLVNAFFFTVVLESTAAAPTFQGFLVQARMIAGDTTVVGQFEDLPTVAGGEYRFGSCTPTEVYYIMVQKFHKQE